MSNYISYARSDGFSLARSKTIAAPADGTHNLIQIPRYAFITDVFIEIFTAYTNADAVLTVGYLGNAEDANTDGFMTTNLTKPTQTGIKRSVKEALGQSSCYWFKNGSGVLTVTTDDNGGTAGTFVVFVAYSVLH